MGCRTSQRVRMGTMKDPSMTIARTSTGTRTSTWILLSGLKHINQTKH